jgi:hypothetical protein
VLGLIGLGAGGVAVFVTHVEAGPVALLIIGLVFLLIGMGGRMPTRIKVGDNEAAWEAVQEFVERVTEEIPAESRREVLDAIGDLAQAAPELASPVLQGLTYEALIASMIDEILVTIPADKLGQASVQIASTPGFDIWLKTSDRDVGVEVRYSSKLVPSAVIEQLSARLIDPGISYRYFTFLLVTRTPLTAAAAALLTKQENIYVVVVEGAMNRERLRTALWNALGLEQTGHYFA